MCAEHVTTKGGASLEQFRCSEVASESIFRLKQWQRTVVHIGMNAGTSFTISFPIDRLKNGK